MTDTDESSPNREPTPAAERTAAAERTPPDGNAASSPTGEAAGGTTTAAATTPAPEPTPYAAHRTRGLVAQVAGLVGIVVCIALVVGIWFGRSWLVDGIGQVSGRMDDALARGATVAQTAGTAITGIATTLGDVSSRAQAVANDSSASSDSLGPLASAASAVVDRYGQFRSSYASLRETVVNTVETLRRLDRLIPGFSVPEGPIDAIATVDQKVQDLDATITRIANADIVAGKVSDAASALAAQTSQAQATLTGVAASLAAIGDRATTLRTDVSNAVDRSQTVILLVVIGATLLLLYGVFLNLVLWNAGRRWRRGDRAP